MVWEGPRSNPGPYPDFVRFFCDWGSTMKWKCVVGDKVYICELSCFDGEVRFGCNGFAVPGIEVAIAMIDHSEDVKERSDHWS